MKCALSVLFMAVCAAEFITAIPVRNGMVFYQSNPDYYNGHRAFVMQYASQPVKAYRRNGVPASSVNGVSAFVSGKKISTGTILKQQQSIEEQDELPVLDGAAHSVATAFPDDDDEVESSIEEEKNFVPTHDVPEDIPSPADDEPVEQPSTSIETTKKKLPRKPVKPTVADEEVEDDDDDEVPPVQTVVSRNRSQGGAPIYFPVHFGSTNGGAIAVANSYSTGKGGSASSHATAYGSPSKAKKSTSKKN